MSAGSAPAFLNFSRQFFFAREKDGIYPDTQRRMIATTAKTCGVADKKMIIPVFAR